MPLRDAGLLGERRVDWRHETESRRPSARMQSPTRVYEWGCLEIFCAVVSSLTPAVSPPPLALAVSNR